MTFSLLSWTPCFRTDFLQPRLIHHIMYVRKSSDQASLLFPWGPNGGQVPLFSAFSLNCFFFFQMVHVNASSHIRSKWDTRNLSLSVRAWVSLFLEPHHRLPTGSDLIWQTADAGAHGWVSVPACILCSSPMTTPSQARARCETLLERPRVVCTPRC